jgi:5-methylcytosine-specific restriction endonuclease McrA
MTTQPEGWLTRREYATWLRCQKYGVTYTRVNRAKVFRDSNWLCGICGQPVNSKLRYPNPLSASLDHIVPLVRGTGSPGHVQANCQLAHFICNSTAGAKH